MKHFLNSRYFSELMHLRSGTFCSFHFIDDKSEFRKIRKLVQVVGFEVREQGPQSPAVTISWDAPAPLCRAQVKWITSLKPIRVV